MPQRANERRSASRFAWWVLGLGLIAAWWLPLLSPPIPTFYKEWLFVVAFGFTGLALGQGLDVRALARHPLVLAGAATVAVLIVQSLVMDGVWHKAMLTASGAVFFVFAIVLGRALRQDRGDESLTWLAGYFVVAALGSCFDRRAGREGSSSSSGGRVSGSSTKAAGATTRTAGTFA